MILLYSYSKCSTCQKAIRLLTEKLGKEGFQIKEITNASPTLEELKQMLHYKDGEVKKLFNTSGQLYRELQLTEKLKNMPLEQALDFLNKNGMLVKRPFLLGANFGLTGFNQAEWLKTI